jgi:hypothetical protein
MDLTQKLGDRNRLTRTLLAVVLAVFALHSLHNGKRLRGGVAGLGALALAYTTTTGFGEVADAPEREPTSTSRQLRCAVCGEPIITGQSRRPNADGETVHEACLPAPA